ncbi:MAG TPA: hypothetical protein VGZ29_07545 [Terriglobia bacterium]|nr:hypothetical protein [Terriglobia bacterium]
MPEFRIGDDALKRQARFRMFSWGTVLLLVAVATLLLVFRASGYIGDSSDLGSLFVLIVLSAAIIAIILAPREGLRRAERKMVFVLDDTRIVRKRIGYPDVEIAFSEIEILREELRWLVITSTEPRRKIAVPTDVSGYELIRTELAKRHSLAARAAFPLKSTALVVTAVLGWAAVLWFRDMRAIIAGGAVALATLAFGSYRLWIVLHRSVKRPLLWACLGLAWLAALLVIYLCVVHP